MARKRADGEGTITQRSDGRWMGRLSVSREIDGKVHRLTVCGSTPAEVVEKLKNLRQQRDTNSKSVVGKDTVAVYLQRWLDDHIALNRAGKTLQEYSGIVKLYITPNIGHVKLSKLDGDQLFPGRQRWLGKVSAQTSGSEQSRFSGLHSIKP